MNKGVSLQEALVKAIITEGTENEFEYLLKQIKEQEVEFYQYYIDMLYNYDLENRQKSQPKDDSEEESAKWTKYLNGRDAVIDDYDVRDFEYMLLQGKSKEEQQNKLVKFIDEHITKLRKSIAKVIGNVTDINKVDENIYNLEGEKGTCTLQVTPIKLSSTKSVTKARFKVANVEEKVIQVDKEENSIEDNEYIKEWKQKELEGFIKARDYYNQHCKELEEAEQEAENEYKVARQKYVDEHNGEAPQTKRTYNGIEILDPELNKIYQNKESKKYDYIKFAYNENQFYHEYGNSNDFEERCMKIINKHFQELQAKVQKKIGKIIKITDFGGDDYGFEGENGRCMVEVIWAGGYNIQRLHTRWIVKNWNGNDELD